MSYAARRAMRVLREMPSSRAAALWLPPQRSSVSTMRSLSMEPRCSRSDAGASSSSVARLLNSPVTGSESCRKRHGRVIGRPPCAVRPAGHHLVDGQVLKADHRSVAEEQGALHHVAKLADVAWPRVLQHQSECRRVEVRAAQPAPPTPPPRNSRASGSDLLEALAQRRQRQQDAVEPEEQVRSEPASLDFRLEVTIRGGHEADVDGSRAQRADAAYLALLEHAQELALGREGHLANLVEEHRAAIGGLEQPRLRRRGAGEGPSFVSEHLALQQRLGERRAVEPEEGARCTRRGVVDRASHDLLADARLPEDEHGDLGGGDAREHRTQAFQRPSPTGLRAEPPLACPAPPRWRPR